MRYVKAKFDEKQKDFAYRIYITDSLFAMGRNQMLEQRFYDLLKPRVEDKRSGDEIAFDVIQKLGLKVEK